jgi:hypothetical protein
VSWHFSRALVEAYSPAICSGGEQSVQSKSTATPRLYSQCDKMTASCRRFRSGMTCEHLTEHDGEAVLTSFLEDSPAKTSALTAKETDSTESGRDCGQKWHGSFAKLDRNSCSWKTPQPSLFVELKPYWLIWPRWGSMRNGGAYRQANVGPITNETGSGSLPTPRCHDAKKMYPAEMKRKSPCLAALVMFSDDNDSGLLNPEFVEHLMGWPIGWTALDALAMDKFHEWQQQHGAFWLGGVDDESIITTG